MPFIEEIIDGVLDRSGVSPVVLRQDEDKSRVFLDLLTPGPRVRLHVIFIVFDLRWDGGFVKHREFPLGQVDELKVLRSFFVCGSCCFDGLGNESCNLWTNTGLPC